MTTKDIVMNRVRRIFLMQPFVSTGALCAVLVLVSLYAISREVWVAMVFANMPSVSNIGALTSFLISAFLNTSFLVQAFTILALSSALTLARETARTLEGAMLRRA